MTEAPGDPLAGARRVLGIDLGSKRVGVAVSDRSGTLASPLVVLQRSGDRGRDHAAIRALVVEEEAEGVVVGLPLSLDGSLGPAAQAALAEVEALASVVGVPVTTYDERFTTVSAERPIREMKMSASQRRRAIDMRAAAVILQAWLDGRAAPEDRVVNRRSRVVQDWSADPWDDPDGFVEVVAERPRRPAYWTRALGFSVFVMLVVAILVVGGVGFWVIRQIDPAGEPGAKVNFTVAADDTFETVTARLEEKGIITSARVFREYVARKGGLVPRPGYYTVRPKDNMGNIVAVLRTPPAQTFRNVTFPEGYTVADMAKRVSTELPAGQMGRQVFEQVAYTGEGMVSRFRPDTVASLEGLLFPDTYQVAGNETEAQLVKRMADRLDRVATQLGIDKPPVAGATPYQVLIVASIIEKEAKVDEDRAKISAVIWNRLRPDTDMPLEIDATLLYQQDAKLPFAQLRAIDTPYNTYLHKGLPATPISNPGSASIRAALHPAADPDPSQCAKGDPCRYLYYVLADAQGRHAFATTAAGHEANVAKARAAGLLG